MRAFIRVLIRAFTFGDEELSHHDGVVGRPAHGAVPPLTRRQRRAVQHELLRLRIPYCLAFQTTNIAAVAKLCSEVIPLARVSRRCFAILLTAHNTQSFSLNRYSVANKPSAHHRLVPSQS